MSAIEFSATQAAITHIKAQLEKRGKGIGIRVGVRTTGCSGLAYTLEYVDEPAPGDKSLMVAENAGVYVDPKAYEYLKGSTIDYVKRGLNEGFEFINPNEKNRCGCGESFTV